MPNTRKPEIVVICTDADGIAANTESVMVVLDISRREIESGNISSTLDRLLVLSDTREAAYLYRESLLFQVGGYDNDPRELPEIPAVRAFFAKLADEWPHWLWFLHRDIGAVPLLMALLCQVKIHRGNGRYGTEFTDRHEVHRRALDLFARGNALFTAFGITAAEAEVSANSAIDEILG